MVGTVHWAMLSFLAELAPSVLRCYYIVCHAGLLAITVHCHHMSDSLVLAGMYY